MSFDKNKRDAKFASGMQGLLFVQVTLEVMQSKNDSSEQIASNLLAPLNLKLKSCTVVQRLWAGYGYICRLEAVDLADNEIQSLILKYVMPPGIPTQALNDEGHVRKVLSYQVEQYFYTHLAPLMPDNITIASCLASIDARSSLNSNTTAMILSDLRVSFSVAGDRRATLSKTQVYAALDWLGHFHGFWWRSKDFDRQTLCQPPLEHARGSKSTNMTKDGVWLNGGYTYLSTRQKEYASLCSDIESEWSKKLCNPIGETGLSIAQLAAKFLSPSSSADVKSSITDFETLIHGDVKSENLFTSKDGSKVAFFDFQYVGLGLGVCDLAKLFTCSIPISMLITENASSSGSLEMSKQEEELLHRYMCTISTASGKEYSWESMIRHWETALVDWLRFQASWGFWGNTEWLEARVRSILSDSSWTNWLLVSTA